MTTPYIEAKKAEIRKEFLRWFKEVQIDDYSLDSKAWKRQYTGEELPERNDIPAFIDSIIDTLLDEIQEAVKLPEKGERTTSDYDAGYEQGWNQREYKLEAAFQHLRTGVETE